MAPRSKFSTEPLYARVRNLLAQRIASGIWAPGSMLPNEMELARELGVSSGTVRKALDSLESDRLVLRRQGRGTSVVDQATGDAAARFSNIRDEAGRRVAGDIEVLTQAMDRPTPIEQLRLQLEARDAVLRTARRRRHENRVFMYEEVALAVGRFPGLEGEEPGAYRISAVAQRHGIHLAKASERLTLDEAASLAARQLEVEEGAPLMKLDRVVYATNGSPVEWRVAFCTLNNDLLYLAEMT